MKSCAQHHLKRLPLSIAIATAITMAAPSAFAFEFDVTDEVKGSFDTTLSYGAMWRVEGRDKRLLLPANGGVRNSGNYDNGNANYESGDMVSSLFKMTNDLSLDYKNYGAFFRVLSFYDQAIMSKDFNPNRADEKVIRNRLGADYEIYDAYLRANFTLAEKNVGVRVGKQVISWGESTFIPNGINTLNPVDVAKLRAPGSELKEAFLPIGMSQLTFDVTDNLSMELVHQYQFRATRLEPNGSYFSTNDFASPGGSKVLVASGAASETPPIPPALGPGTFIPRGPDKEPNGSDQYAVAARLLMPSLNNTEFGLYHAKYHSRTPLISGRAPSSVAGLTGNPAVDPLILAGRSTYNIEYPKGIEMYGFSFNTLGPMGVALQGEYSFRPNQPLQLAANNLLNELLSLGQLPLRTGINPVAPGTYVEGYKRVKVHQAQVTATQTLGRLLGATQVVGVAEAGFAYLDLPSNLDFNGPGLDYTTTPTSPGGFSTSKGIMTKNSYGYRAVLRATYDNAIGAINVSPRVAFSHDIRGTSPTFVQGTKAATLGVGFDYQSQWQADLSYTNFFGGEQIIGPLGAGQSSSTTQQLNDRDFIAASISYSF